jgi:hypothetical protein
MRRSSQGGRLNYSPKQPESSNSIWEQINIIYGIHMPGKRGIKSTQDAKMSENIGQGGEEWRRMTHQSLPLSVQQPIAIALQLHQG